MLFIVKIFGEYMHEKIMIKIKLFGNYLSTRVQYSFIKIR